MGGAWTTARAGPWATGTGEAGGGAVEGAVATAEAAAEVVGTPDGDGGELGGAGLGASEVGAAGGAEGGTTGGGGSSVNDQRKVADVRRFCARGSSSTRTVNR
jgi:hypothetical protein